LYSTVLYYLLDRGQTESGTQDLLIEGLAS